MFTRIGTRVRDGPTKLAIESQNAPGPYANMSNKNKNRFIKLRKQKKNEKSKTNINNRSSTGTRTPNARNNIYSAGSSVGPATPARNKPDVWYSSGLYSKNSRPQTASEGVKANNLKKALRETARAQLKESRKKGENIKSVKNRQKSPNTVKTGGRRNRATENKIKGIVEYPGSIEQFKRDLISKAETLKQQINDVARERRKVDALFVDARPRVINQRFIEPVKAAKNTEKLVELRDTFKLYTTKGHIWNVNKYKPK